MSGHMDSVFLSDAWHDDIINLIIDCGPRPACVSVLVRPAAAGYNG